MKTKLIIFISVILFIIINVLLYNHIKKANNREKPVVVDGIIDLSLWDFNKNGRVELDGNWEFYWNQFIYPSQFKEKKNSKKLNFIHVPCVWNKQPAGQKSYDSFGFATYRLIIKMNEKSSMKAFKIPETISVI